MVNTMTDYVAIALQGFSTGIGVIVAHEFWDWLKKYRSDMREKAKKFSWRFL